MLYIKSTHRHLFCRFKMTILGAPEFTPVYSAAQVDQYWLFCVVFCRPLFVFCLLIIVLSSTIHTLWLPLWYLQSFLMGICYSKNMSCEVTRLIEIIIYIRLGFILGFTIIFQYKTIIIVTSKMYHVLV
jgi:hypothetical protein